MNYTPSPAGFWKRYVAYFIDIIILYIAVQVLSTLYFSFQLQSELGTLIELYNSLKASMENGDTPNPQLLMEKLQSVLMPALIFSTVVYSILSVIYFSVTESSAQQATLGKRLLGIKVTNTQGNAIALPQAIARYFAASLSWISMNIGHALAAWTPERRALHDYIAGTRVENVDPNNTKMPIWAWLIVALHALVFIGSCVLLMAMVWLLMQQISEL